ncbi:uncharacterized protein BJX67DRAFT_383166 [Aspergillus lucknowensis]|uniref:Uncharacterized protein n=1 Tax=Aspergillus lucknowensis TaxID=176173 RepID=A0ABR4LKW8_9EURO
MPSYHLNTLDGYAALAIRKEFGEQKLIWCTQSATMQSSQNNPITEQAKKAVSGVQEAASSLKPKKDSKKDPTSGWTLEEMLETGMDKNGNPVPDAISYIDGARMSKGERGFKDEADEVSAALDDFD